MDEYGWMNKEEIEKNKEEIEKNKEVIEKNKEEIKNPRQTLGDKYAELYSMQIQFDKRLKLIEEENFKRQRNREARRDLEQREIEMLALELEGSRKHQVRRIIQLWKNVRDISCGRCG
jgi:methylphosphotriester-DNA--protein-cysteine methyltransferase